VRKHIGSCCGNSFLIMDCIHGKISRAKKVEIARRDLSKYRVDSLLILERSANDSLMVEIFERNGAESDSCGNGALLIAKFLDLSQGVIEMKGGIIEVASNEKRLAVRMNISATDIREVNGSRHCLFVRAGEPHLVYFVDNIGGWNLMEAGANLQAEYPSGINVNAISRIKDFCYSIKTYERGVLAETKSCGTGALASYMALAHLDNCLYKERVELRSVCGSHWVSRYGDILQLEVLKDCCEIRCL